MIDSFDRIVTVISSKIKEALCRIRLKLAKGFKSLQADRQTDDGQNGIKIAHSLELLAQVTFRSGKLKST